MTDRFDLEQQILDCWHVTDDLKILLESIMEKDLTQDQIANIVLGLQELYNLKFRKCFDMFETLIQQKKIV